MDRAEWAELKPSTNMLFSDITLIVIRQKVGRKVCLYYCHRGFGADIYTYRYIYR